MRIYKKYETATYDETENLSIQKTMTLRPLWKHLISMSHIGKKRSESTQKVV